MGQPMPNYVPFGGGAELATQLVAGAVDVGTLNSVRGTYRKLKPVMFVQWSSSTEIAMAPIPKAKTSVEMGIDLELATVRGYATHAGVDKARRDELEAGMMKAMNHSLYQAYLMNSGLNETSPMGAEEWGKQMKMMVNEFGPASKRDGLGELDTSVQIKEIAPPAWFCAEALFHQGGEQKVMIKKPSRSNCSNGVFP